MLWFYKILEFTVEEFMNYFNILFDIYLVLLDIVKHFDIGF